MSTKADCKDLFHKYQAAPHIEYTFEHGGWISTGNECCSCGMRTATLIDDDGNDVTPITSSRRVGWTFGGVMREVATEIPYRVQKAFPPKCRECGARRGLAAYNTFLGFQRSGICGPCFRKDFGDLTDSDDE